MKHRNTRPRAALDRNEWVEAAIAVLAEQGVQGMRIEVLAKDFGVTKGSFYWHFKDRQDLFNAVLDDLARRSHPRHQQADVWPRPARSTNNSCT
jgi:AcrR family transcriptional regulator